MGSMADLRRLSIIALAVALLLVPLLGAGGASGSGASLTGSSPRSTVQYSPQAQFSANTVFDNQSSAISVDPYARDFAVGDLNHDGLQDVAVISNKTNSICIYNRTASGTLSDAPWRISKPGVVDMRSIAIGDLNNDGLNDIVVSYNDTGGNGHICIFNQSIAGFSASNSFSKDVMSEPWKVVIGHFDGTINYSVATICMGDKQYSDDYIDIWRYPFTTVAKDRCLFQVVTSSPQFIKSKFLAAGDVNNDGRTDLIVGNESGKNVFIALQPSSWKSSWTTSTKPIAGSCSDVELADVMGNGRSDLVFADSSNTMGYSNVLVYANDGTTIHSGTGLMPNAEAALKTPLGLGSVAIGELSNGTASDVLALSMGYSNASAYIRNTTTSWLGPNPNFTFPVDFSPLKAIIDRSIADKPGVFILSQGTSDHNGTLAWYGANPSLTGNANENRFAGLSSPTTSAIGKMANGDIVMATALTSSDQITLYKKNGSVSRTLYSNSGPMAIAFGHFDSDGNEDMAVLNINSRNISLWNGSQLFIATKPYKSITLPFADPKCITSASLRGDGYDDLVIGYGSGGYILYNKEDGTYFDTSVSEYIGNGIAGGRTSAVVADLDGDGLSADIAILNANSHNIEVYLRNDTGTPGHYFNKLPTANLTSPEAIISIVAANFGGSSAADIAALTTSGKVLFFIQPSFGFIQNWVPDAQISLAQKANSLSAGDVNDDGLADIVVSYQDMPVAAAYLRTGSATFKNALNFTTGALSSSVIAGDINGDGRCDIACSSPGSHSVSIWYQHNLAPSAAISPVSSAYEGDSVTFSGEPSQDSYSDMSTLNYSWTFGDGGFGYGKVVYHQYMENGSYIVHLTVRDRGALSNSTSLITTIKDKIPIVDFYYLPSNPTEGQTVTFTQNSSSSPDRIISYDWSFSDTSIHVSDPNTTHVFAQQGSYSVTLTVRDDGGSENHTTRTVIVSDTHPTASFTENTTFIFEGGSVSFTDTSTRGMGNEPITYWNWTFGDGQFSDLRNVDHVYVNVGHYTVTLRVKDSDDTTWNASSPVVIDVANIPPQANFTWSPQDPVEMRPVTFIDTSWHYAGDTLTNWTWAFGDGKGGYGSSVEHSYAVAGNYQVNLTVKDDDGSTSTTSKTITILDTRPIANFTIGPSWPIEGSTVFFNSTTTIFAPIAYYNWTITGAPEKHGAEVTWIFDQSYWYNATLNVTDIHGRSDSCTIHFQVHDSNITLSFSWSPSLPLEGQEVRFQGKAISYDAINIWTWTIGNVTVLNGSIIFVTFDRAGNYSVELTVIDKDETTANLTRTVTIGETYPKASFTMWPQVPDEGAWVDFNDTSEPSNVSHVQISHVQWVFDGIYANTTPNCRFDFGDGPHTAMLIVWDAHGIKNTSSMLEFNVTDLAPIANFTFGDAVEGSQTHFTSTSWSAWDWISYNWSFGGDGFGTNSSSVNHTFNMKGWYNVTLTVTDSQLKTSSKSEMVFVTPRPPIVALSVVGASVEGSATTFKLVASTYNSLVSCNWSFDGNRTWTIQRDVFAGTAYSNHTFADNGSYWVSVNVTEADGDWTLVSIPVDVQDTSPVVLKFWPANGVNYTMDQEVSFWATAAPTYKTITKYEWNFNYYAGGQWIASDPPLANHTTYAFTTPGNHFVMVRVWDDDSAKEYSTPMQVYVNNVQPVAKFSYLNDTKVSGRVQFDASLSSDSPSDITSLLYSWNFGDGSGWTPYANSAKVISWDFPIDNRYNVSLMVKDQWGLASLASTATIVIDRTPPALVMESTGANATADKSIVVSAQVTDPFGVSKVLLTYKVGNGSWVSLPMTPTEQPNVYAGQIPAQKANTTVYYQIQATDTTNNTYTTQTFQIDVRAASSDVTSGLLWIIGLLALIIVLLVLFILFRPVPVDEVFIIYEDGRLMAHQTRRLKPGMDDEILSSMLIAIQSFVKDSFKDESATHLQRLDFGDKKILVERGESFYLAVVLHSHRAGKVPQRMQAVIEDIHKDYGTTLRAWDGDLEKVRGIRDHADRLFKGPIPLALPGNGKKAKAPQPTECPMCGSTIEPSAKSCPSCGAELAMSTVDDLETVAKGLDEEHQDAK